MLYNVADGPCTQSFGINVATSAGFPDEVIKEAKRKSDELEKIGVFDENDAAGEFYVLSLLVYTTLLPYCSRINYLFLPFLFLHS